MEKAACIESEKTNVKRFTGFAGVNSGLKIIKEKEEGSG